MLLFTKSKPALYEKCNQIFVHNFDEAITNGNFEYLKKHENVKATPQQIETAWVNILDEFIRISKNTIAISGFKKKAQIIKLDKKLQVLQALKNCIDRNINVDNVLKEYRVNKSQIDTHIGLLKNDLSRVSKAKNNDVDEKHESDIDRSIAICLKNGFQINRFTTVVSEWCQMLHIIEKQNKPKT